MTEPSRTDGSSVSEYHFSEFPASGRSFERNRWTERNHLRPGNLRDVQTLNKSVGGCRASISAKGARPDFRRSSEDPGRELDGNGVEITVRRARNPQFRRDLESRMDEAAAGRGAPEIPAGRSNGSGRRWTRSGTSTGRGIPTPWRRRTSGRGSSSAGAATPTPSRSWSGAWRRAPSRPARGTRAVPDRGEPDGGAARPGRPGGRRADDEGAPSVGAGHRAAAPHPGQWKLRHAMMDVLVPPAWDEI